MDIAKDTYLKFGPYLELMTGLRTALNINEGIIKLIGQEGAGKSAICRQLAAELRAAHCDVIFFETPPESSDYLYQRIQSELGLTADKNFNNALTKYLQAKSPPNNKLVIIYDDAEKISSEIFILIRLLNNIHGHAETLVSQVICGTRKLDRIFDEPELRSLTQYLNQSFTLEPMTREEIEDFHAGYRKEKGLTLQTLSNKTLTEIFISGKGLPGKTLEMFDRYYQPRKTAPAPDGPVAKVDPDGMTVNAPGDGLATAYAREVDAILDGDEYRPGRFPLYFKAVLSVTIILVTLVLALVLSGDNDRIPSRLAAILEDDSPLYLDEVVTGTDTTTGPVTTTPSPPTQELVEGESTPGNEAATESFPDDEPLPGTTGNGEARLAVAGNPGEGSADPGITTAEAAPTQDPATGSSSQGEPEPEVAASTPAASREIVASSETPGETVPAAIDTAGTGTDGSAEEQQSDPAAANISTESALAAAITDWTRAWQAGDFAGYLAAYAGSFMSAPEEDRMTWETQRRERIDHVTGISIDFDRMEITSMDDSNATVRFWLYYSRGNYADETLKEILFERHDDNWLIADERSLEIITR